MFVSRPAFIDRTHLHSGLLAPIAVAGRRRSGVVEWRWDYFSNTLQIQEAYFRRKYANMRLDACLVRRHIRFENNIALLIEPQIFLPAASIFMSFEQNFKTKVQACEEIRMNILLEKW